MSGNFEICQGKIKFWKMAGKTDLCQGKIKFPGGQAKNLLIQGHQVLIFSFFSYKNVHATVKKLLHPLEASIYNENLINWQGVKFLYSPIFSDQTCKSSADPRNSAVFDISRVILEICPDPRRT